MVEITNAQELEAWLEGQPREVGVAIACRAALRCFPRLTGSSGNLPKSTVIEDFMMIGFRCLHTTHLVNTRSSANLMRAAREAGQQFSVFLSSAVTVEANAHFYATLQAIWTAVRLAGGLHSEGLIRVDEHAAYAVLDESRTAQMSFWEAVTWDARQIDDQGVMVELMTSPIWPSDMPKKIVSQMGALQEIFLHHLELEFWARWYGRITAGDVLNWDMQEKIALIPDEDWEKGAVHVSKLIAEIEARYEQRLDQEKIVRCVERLLAFPKQSEAAALKAVQEMEDLCTEFLRKAELNDLPIELKAFGTLKQVLRHVAQIVASSESKDQKIEKLEAEIEALHAEVARLQEELAGVGWRGASEEFKKAVGKGAANPAWWAGWAGVVAYSYFFVTDPAGAGAMIERIVSTGAEAINQAPDADVRKSPQIGVDPGSSPG